MNKFISLTKLQIKDFMSRYQSGLNLRNGMIGKALMIVVGILLLVPAIQLAQFLYQPLALAGYPYILVTYMYVAAVLFMLFTAIPFIMSIFFYSKDATFLSSLPITENTIVFSKLTTVYMGLLGVNAIILGPGLVVYLMHQEIHLVLIVSSILTFMVSPILPLVIATLLVFPIMRMVSGSKRRNLFSILGSILLLVLIIGMQLLVARFQTDPETMQQLLSQPNGILKFVGYGFPPSVWATNMIRGEILDALLFLGTTLLLSLLLAWVSKKIFQRAMMAFTEQGSVNIKKGTIYYKKSSVGMQLVKRHILIITSNPTFFLNTVLTMLVPIIIFAISFFTGEISLEVFNSPLLESYKVLVFAGILSSPAIIGNISSTAITREGKTFWQTKVLPISHEDNLRYRVITTIILNLFSSLILGVVSALVISLSMVEIALGLLLCLTLTLFLATVDIIVNIFRPLLNWTHPTAAVKNNMNIMISLAFRVLLGGILYGLFLIVKGVDFHILLLLSSALFFVLYMISRHLVYKVYVDKFKEISI